MKKYIVAASVAIMALVMSAFAASLDVDAGTLQVGTDSVTCTDGTVEVDFSGHEGDTPSPSGVPSGWKTVQVSGLADCEGENVFVRAFNQNGNEIWQYFGPISGDELSIPVGDGTYKNQYEFIGSGNTPLLGTAEVGEMYVHIASQ